MFYILWEVEIKSDQLGNLAEISKQSVKGSAWFLLLSVKEKRGEMSEVIFKQKITRTWKFGKFSAYPYCNKLRKGVQQRTLRAWPSDFLIRGLMWIYTDLKIISSEDRNCSSRGEWLPKSASEVIRAAAPTTYPGEEKLFQWVRPPSWYGWARMLLPSVSCLGHC